LNLEPKKFLGVRLAPGVSARHLATHYYAALAGLGLMVFAGAVQPFVLTSLLRVPLEAQGAATGRLGLANEVAILLTVSLFGAFSDKIGRKPVYAAGLLLMALAYFLYPSAGGLNGLTVLRAVFALGASAFSAMLGTVLADYVANEDRGKAGGIMGVFNGLGAMLAATVFLSIPTRLEARGMDTVSALQTTFYIAAGIALVSAVVLWLGLKSGVETQETGRKSFLDLAREGVGAARDPGVALAYAAAFVSRGDLALAGQFLLLWVNKYGLEQGLSEADARKQAQLAFVVPQAAALLAAPVVGILSDRLNRAAAVALLVGVSAVGYSSLFFINNPLSGTMKLALLVVGVGEIGGVVASQALIAQQAPRAIRGSVIGVFGFCGALGILTAFTVGGRLFDTWKESAPFFMFGVFGSLVAVWGLLIYRRVRPPREILEK
jgi:MFS family permease